jgi:hypothetical protein
MGRRSSSEKKIKIIKFCQRILESFTSFNMMKRKYPLKLVAIIMTKEFDKFVIPLAVLLTRERWLKSTIP